MAATFNVPIRTVVLRAGADGATTATCGIGSGIAKTVMTFVQRLIASSTAA